MMGHMQKAPRRAWWRVRDLLSCLVHRLQGAEPLSRNSQPPDPLESAMRIALRPVVPSSSFREALRRNLSFATQGRILGLSVENPKPFRQGIILGVSAGLLAAAIATLVVVFRWRLSNSEG